MKLPTVARAVILSPKKDETKEDKIARTDDGAIDYVQAITIDLMPGQPIPQPGAKVSIQNWDEYKEYTFVVVSHEHSWALKNETLPIIALYVKDMTLASIDRSVPHPRSRIVTLGGR